MKKFKGIKFIRYFLILTLLSGLMGNMVFAQTDGTGSGDTLLNNNKLEIKFVNEFQLIWDDKGSGASLNGSFYKPVLPDGYYSLGHYGERSYDLPGGSVIAVKELEAGALARPISMQWVYNDDGSGSNRDGTVLYPVPPSGYVSLGCVVYPGHDLPSNLLDYFPEIRCVRADLVLSATAGDLIWKDSGSGGDHDFSSWKIVPSTTRGLNAGTFVGVGNYTKPQTHPLLHCLNKDYVISTTYNSGTSTATTALTTEEVNAAIAKYGPVVYLHPEEQYLMDNAEYYLDNAYLECGPVVITGSSDEEQYNNFQKEVTESVDTSSASLLNDLSYIKNKYATQFSSNQYFKYWLNIGSEFYGGNMTRAKTYVDVCARGLDYTDLQFNFFYPYNGSGKLRICIGNIKEEHYLLDPVGRHVADTEHVTLRIDNRTKELMGIFMTRHSGGEWIFKGDLKSRVGFEGTHPVIYSAKDSHAHYVSSGDHYYNRVWSLDFGIGTAAADLKDICGTGSKFESWQPGKYQIVTPTSPYWLQFDGRWGPAEKLSKTVTFNYVVGSYSYTYNEVGNGAGFQIKYDNEEQEGVYLFKDWKYGGGWIKLNPNQQDWNLVDMGFNDMTSSIKIVGNYEATVYADLWSGTTSTFRFDCANFSNTNVGNDKATCVRISPVSTTDKAGVYLFEYPDYEGRWIRLDPTQQDWNLADMGFNDIAGSVKIVGDYKAAAYTGVWDGDGETFSMSCPNLKYSLVENGTISTVRVTQ